jgi:hypothetical protein
VANRAKRPRGGGPEDGGQRIGGGSVWPGLSSAADTEGLRNAVVEAGEPGVAPGDRMLGQAYVAEVRSVGRVCRLLYGGESSPSPRRRPSVRIGGGHVAKVPKYPRTATSGQHL